MPNFTNFFAIAAATFSAVGLVPYVWAILKGQTKPSGASWWTWTLINFVTILSSWFAGASWQVLVLPLWLCIVYITIAVLSIKRGDNNWDTFNKFSVAGACVGILLWAFTGQPLMALALSIISDIFASIPNFRHVFKNPEQENRLGWTLGWASAACGLLAMSTFSLAESGWAIYFFSNMSITLVLLYRKSMFKS